MNRMATKAPQNLPTVTTVYNLRSEPTSLTTPAGSFTSGATSFTIPAHSLAYDYDDAGRKISETSDGRQVSYGYDGAGGQSGSRTRTVWPDGYRVSYVYDALNRMSTVWEGLPNTTQLADYRYDALQRRQRLQYANQANHRVDYSYEPDNNLDVLTHVLNTVQVTLDYAYNGSGQIAHFANAGH
jgi:YD repeat-containing protein